MDNAFGNSDTEMDLSSDVNGLFFVRGIRAVSIGVVVTKDGYLTLGDRGLENPASSRSIDFGLSDSKGKQFKDPDHPTLFTLHKIGPVEPLVYVKEKRWRLVVDGTPRKIALDSEKGIGAHQIEFRFLSGWSQIPSGKRYGRRFDWSLEAHIPGGGFIKNKSDYNFVAPEAGYEETIQIEYAAAMPQGQWKRSRSERYFVIFSDGTHGRIRFDIDGASDDGPLSMTSWMNLKPGSRNLASFTKDNTDMPDE